MPHATLLFHLSSTFVQQDSLAAASFYPTAKVTLHIRMPCTSVHANHVLYRIHKQARHHLTCCKLRAVPHVSMYILYILVKLLMPCTVRAPCLLQFAVPISLMTSHDITYMFYGRFSLKKQIQKYNENTRIHPIILSLPFLDRRF